MFIKKYLSVLTILLLTLSTPTLAKIENIDPETLELLQLVVDGKKDQALVIINNAMTELENDKELTSKYATDFIDYAKSAGEDVSPASLKQLDEKRREWVAQYVLVDSIETAINEGYIVNYNPKIKPLILGLSHELGGDNLQAAESYANAVKLDSNNELYAKLRDRNLKIFSGEGIFKIYNVKNKAALEEALSILDRAEAINPELHDKFLHIRYDGYSRIGDEKSVKKIIEEFNKIHPKGSAERHAFTAMRYYESDLDTFFKESDKAIALYKDGNAKKSMLEAQASIYLDKNDYDQAIKKINQALEIDGDSFSLYSSRSRIYSFLGKETKAKRDQDTADRLLSKWKEDRERRKKDLTKQLFEEVIDLSSGAELS